MTKRVGDMTPAEREMAWLAYRFRVLPDQLDRARRRVAHLEREAARLGISA